MHSSKIVGVGHHVPEAVITNQYLTTIMDTTDEWIIERTGIKERRWIDPAKDTVANMAAKASRIALQRANLTEKDIDFIVFATITPDYFFPGSGVLLQRELGLDGSIGAIDIRNACSGFIYALSVADQFIKTGMYKTILVVGAEIQSTAIDATTRGRNTAVIFADGAGAAVLQRSDKPGILSTHLHSDGNFAEELYVRDPGSSRSREERQPEQILDTTHYKVVMNGSLVFKHAVVRFLEVIQEALAANKMSKEDITLLIPHQANLRISQFIQHKLEFSDDRVYNNIMRYGNTTAASIPIALSEAWGEGKIKENDVLCLAAFGSGFTWASALIQW
ncbi:MAG: ketoacyl-ACP synthase III [Cytophagales bacterium]|jgi:3-oxoacyl-[acyl-carrier-protein] synthase-3|nr:ketoacyl-ACP synthase III [Cytophagales bacterium]MCA6378755.1 ketoacyl-ACP synthase III [Cytophagales bacterium]MCA6387798.1 ketoacyl-ACP synthase III [Cytophagales bacterium]MCA6390541.1 ketoacyl-ACP synthase III [Cytophagales bacterium]MCA6396142.1 ketoacyl-ACP synthase III [Cytophagales bacterium]